MVTKSCCYALLKLKEEGKLKDDTVVGTVMSNIGFHKAAQELGMKTFATAVGDRYVLEYMREHNLSVGGEQSGHGNLLGSQYNW